jgi:hypothetical protein
LEKVRRCREASNSWLQPLARMATPLESNHSPDALIDVRRKSPMQAPAQLKFDLKLPTGVPLLHLETVAAVLNRDKEDVRDLITRRLLAYAFNIAGRDAERQEVRVLALSVKEYQDNGVKPIRTQSVPDHIIDIILPRHGLTATPQGLAMRAIQLARRLNCDSFHIAHLVRDGLLIKPEQSRGPKESPLILRSSAVAFLKARWL